MDLLLFVRMKYSENKMDSKMTAPIIPPRQVPRALRCLHPQRTLDRRGSKEQWQPSLTKQVKKDICDTTAETCHQPLEQRDSAISVASSDYQEDVFPTLDPIVENGRVRIGPSTSVDSGYDLDVFVDEEELKEMHTSAHDHLTKERRPKRPEQTDQVEEEVPSQNAVTSQGKEEVSERSAMPLFVCVNQGKRQVRRHNSISGMRVDVEFWTPMKLNLGDNNNDEEGDDYVHPQFEPSEEMYLPLEQSTAFLRKGSDPTGGSTVHIQENALTCSACRQDQDQPPTSELVSKQPPVQHHSSVRQPVPAQRDETANRQEDTETSQKDL